MIRIKKEDMQRVRLYELLTNAIVSTTGGRWFVDLPQEGLFRFDTTAELMAFINENLGYMREAYENNGEMEDWRQLEAEAAAPATKSYDERKAERLGLTG